MLEIDQIIVDKDGVADDKDHDNQEDDGSYIHTAKFR